MLYVAVDFVGALLLYEHMEIYTTSMKTNTSIINHEYRTTAGQKLPIDAYTY